MSAGKKPNETGNRPEPSATTNTSYDGSPVGYGKPPAHSQFKRGNKMGGSKKRRPKPEFEDLIRDLLDETVRSTEGGKTRHITVREALLKKARALAMNGSLPDILKFIDLIIKLAPGQRLPVGPITINSIPGDEGL